MESAINIVDKIREINSDDFYTLHLFAAADLIEADRAAVRKECADRAVACFFSTMAESGLSTGNDYAVLVISDKLRAAIEGKP